jgi:hypothetical protein
MTAADEFKPGRRLFDVTEAVLTLLNEHSLSSTKSLEAQLRGGLDLVTRTFVSVLGMKKFGLRCVLHTLTITQKAECVDDSQICPRPTPRTGLSTSGFSTGAKGDARSNVRWSKECSRIPYGFMAQSGSRPADIRVRDWIERLQKVIAIHGNYYSK